MPSDSLPVGMVQSTDQLFKGVQDAVSASKLPTSGQGPSLGDFLKGMPQITEGDMKAALSPIATRGAIQMPSSFTTPHSQILPPAQLDERQVVGAGNARAQGIGNAVSATVRTLSNFKAKRDLAKQEADATRVQRLIEAQYGVDKAQEILKSDPNNAEAKQSLEQNRTVLTGLFQDPKFVKTVEKGFQVSLTDPKSNKTPDHNIVNRGIELFKKHNQQPFSPEQAQAMAGKFAASQPKQLGPNVQAQQALQMKMQQQQLASTIFKAYMPMMVQQARFTQAEMMQKARETFQSQMKYADAVKAFTLQRARAAQATDLEGRRFQHEMALEAVKQSHRLDYMNKEIAAKGGDPRFIQEMVIKENGQYQNDIAKRNADIAKYEGQIEQLTKNKNFKAKKDNPIQQQIDQIRNYIDGPGGLKEGFKQLDLQHAQVLVGIQSLIPKDAGGAGGGTERISESDSGGGSFNTTNEYNRILSESEHDAEEFDPTSLDPSEYSVPQ